jgi:outer membrane biosynthesis protein TonB
VTKKTSDVPVFLIYAGIIHVIGLALLMPMLITLPGPGSLVGSQPAAIDVEIVPAAPLAAKVEPGSEQTSALPSDAPSAERDEAVEPEAGGGAVANVSPEAEVVEEKPAAAEPPVEEAKPKDTAPAKATPRAAKKPVVKRSRTAKTSVKRPSKTETKIAPFNGALTGLFSPGAPANNRRR